MVRFPRRPSRSDSHRETVSDAVTLQAVSHVMLGRTRPRVPRVGTTKPGREGLVEALVVEAGPGVPAAPSGPAGPAGPAGSGSGAVTVTARLAVLAPPRKSLAATVAVN